MNEGIDEVSLLTPENKNPSITIARHPILAIMGEVILLEVGNYKERLRGDIPPASAWAKKYYSNQNLGEITIFPGTKYDPKV